MLPAPEHLTTAGGAGQYAVDAKLETDASTLQSLVFLGARLDEAAVTGDRAVVERFLRCFPRPST
ncbi:hypothetical protein [Amycolatopsis sp. ATCC 39116]|uniref:hypothetical protein n=1 Tax=Amycolatopsis sp. (strain ATCC 39116 / 75iv2) TaxID=385957 RepID=UPI0002629002|nr:hypothetical protein [Amycolatopsis sp. ATCC 39116]